MKTAYLTIIVIAFAISMFPQSAKADWVWVNNDCSCSWGDPGPWDPWWECPCYWDVWVWCGWHPYWMWPWWCRQYVEIYYSPYGHYYYVYYDDYRSGCDRVYVDGRYRYRYSVELERPYSITERIPRRNGLERPIPETVSRRVERLGPEYTERNMSTRPVEQSPTASLRHNESERTIETPQSVTNPGGQTLTKETATSGRGSLEKKSDTGVTPPNSITKKSSGDQRNDANSKSVDSPSNKVKKDSEQKSPNTSIEKKSSSSENIPASSGRSGSSGSDSQKPSKSGSSVSKRR